jgi:small subunit ribosomal protein S9
MYQESAKGAIMVNGKKASQYFPEEPLSIITQSLRTTSRLRDFNISVIVKGGGTNAQAEAVRHGISRGLLIFDEKLRDALKVEGFLTRDPRKKERKKPGLRGARKRPQWSKR